MQCLFVISVLIFFVQATAFNKNLRSNVLKAPVKSQIENWTLELIPARVGEKQFTWIIFVNIFFKIDLPVTVVDGKKIFDLPPSCVDAPLIIFIKFDNMPSLEDTFLQLNSYRNYFNAGKFVIIIPGPPTKKICQFFKQTLILYVVFVEIFENGHMGIYSGECIRMQPNFLMSLNEYLFASTKSIRVCYYEKSPYTILPHSDKGIEQRVVDLVGRYLGMSIEYIKCNISSLCTENVHGSELWEMLYNHSCDAVIGVRPCQKNFRDFDVSATYFSDAVVLIAPKSQCVRRVGFLKISMPLIVLISSTYFLVSYVVCSLSKLVNQETELMWAVKLQVKSSLLSIFFLSAVAFNGFVQGQIFKTLMSNREHCGAESLDEVITQKKTINFESPVLSDFVEKLSIDRNLKVNWQPNMNEKLLDPKTNHIVRLLSYKYHLPQVYTTKNGEAMFREVETLSLIHIGIFFYKKHSLIANVSEALLFILQSGINEKFVETLVASAKKLEVIDKETNKFSTIKFEELEWLFRWYCLGLIISVLVFCGEIVLAGIVGSDSERPN